MVVVVTNESNMASYFPRAGNLNGSSADMCFDMAGPSRSSLGDLFELSDRSNETIILLFSSLLALLAAILDLSVTTTPILLLGRVIQIGQCGIHCKSLRERTSITISNLVVT